jgi:hypothetical protein
MANLDHEQAAGGLPTEAHPSVRCNNKTTHTTTATALRRRSQISLALNVTTCFIWMQRFAATSAM